MYASAERRKEGRKGDSSTYDNYLVGCSEKALAKIPNEGTRFNTILIIVLSFESILLSNYVWEVENVGK